MIDFIAWWDQMIGWVQRITGIVFLALIGIAGIAYLAGGNGGKRIALGCVLSAAVLLVLATYIYTQFGLEILFPDLFAFFEGLFDGGWT